jgi:2-methylisocitrate lyase-like PEP mutase family enzyme
VTAADRGKRATLLRAWHHERRLLVLPNAWDVASALALARVPGCRALATTSGGVARSLGFEDGAAPADEMLRVASRIAAAVDIPVTADLERGYEDPPATVRAAWDAGIVGANIEDSIGGGAPVPIEEQVELLRAVRDAAPDLVLNARIDTFLRGTGGVEDTIERGNAYLAAGADCVFPITIAERADIEAVVEGVGGPVAVIAVPDLPPLDELERIGVARFTWGSGLANAGLVAAAHVAEEALRRRSDPRGPRVDEGTRM